MISCRYFKFIPRYKVRSIGDYILPEDEVLLESVSAKGQYIKISENTLVQTSTCVCVSVVMPFLSRAIPTAILLSEFVACVRCAALAAFVSLLHFSLCL